jgi:hypothetical protein
MLCTQMTSSGCYEVILPLFEPLEKEEETILRDYEKTFLHFRMLKGSSKRSVALNEGAKEARGKWLIFIESHCMMQHDWLEKYLSFLKETKLECVRGEFKDLPSDRMISKAETRLKSYSKHIDAPYYLDFHHTAILKSRFFQAGGLCEDIPILSEFELGARLHHNGLVIGKFAESAVWHKNAASLSSFLKIVCKNGEDWMRTIFLHDNAFCRVYFSTPFIHLWQKLKPIRFLLLWVAYVLIFIGKIGYFFGWLFKIEACACFFLRLSAENTHRLGFIKALREH